MRAASGNYTHSFNRKQARFIRISRTGTYSMSVPASEAYFFGTCRPPDRACPISLKKEDAIKRYWRSSLKP